MLESRFTQRSKARQTALLIVIGVSLVSGTIAQTPTSEARPGPSSTWSTPDFSLGLDPHGLVTSLINPSDALRMNWVREVGPAWGVPMTGEQGRLVTWESPIVATSSHQANELRFTHGPLTLVLKQSLSSAGMLLQSYTLRNTSGTAVSLSEGDFGIRIPLPDNYPDAATALTHRCDVHIWAGGNVAWIEALRMNGHAPHLGLVLTDGAISAYSITDRPQNSNDRGTFVLHPPPIVLAPGQSTTLAWSLFWNKGWDDFFVKAMQMPGFVRLQADRYTVIKGQSIHITADAGSSLAGATLLVNGKPLPAHINGNRLAATYTPVSLGEQHVELMVSKRHTILNAFVSPDPMSLIDARVRFLINHQQKNAPGRPVDGTFLAYDNETHEQILEKTNDHNAGRERVGMGVLLALYLPRVKDPQLKANVTASLDRFLNFVDNHLQDSTGKVFNNTDDPKQRLYNYPWVARLDIAMHQATGTPRYLDDFVRTVRAFYVNGGQRFYPIDLPISDGLAVLSKAGRTEDYKELLELFRGHADRIIATGMAMPKSEVNYEQSIVAPASDILLETYLATKDGKYLDAASPFLEALNAFNGQQPDHHLNDIAIRHWDDYWFGKAKLYGDTFPQYWSTIDALVFDDLALTDPAHAAALRTRGMNIIANNLSYFSADGSASCAYVYPLTINDRPGQFYDAWANDQDWALVHYLLRLDAEDLRRPAR